MSILRVWLLLSVVSLIGGMTTNAAPAAKNKKEAAPAVRPVDPAHESEKGGQGDDLVDAQGRKPGEVGYEVKGADPAKQFVVTGIYTNYLRDGAVFKPDYQQAAHRGLVFVDFKIPKLQKWLNEKKKAGESLTSYDLNDYLNKRVKVTFVGNAQHPQHNPTIHKFKSLYRKNIEILENPDPGQAPAGQKK